MTEAFPLQVGATWRYQAHIEEELGGKVQVRDEIITERVITQTQQANLAIFALKRVGGLNPGPFYYLVWGNSVYRVPPSPRNEALQHFLADLQSDEPTLPPSYVFPLHVRASWGSISVVPQANHWYEWYVEGQEGVDVPAGHFADCYRLVFLTSPDDTTRWFCPGVGLARLRYRHHGSVHNEDWELISYPGMTTATSTPVTPVLPQPTPIPPTYTPPMPPTYTPAPPTGVPSLVSAGTSTPVTPAAAYATQEAARQATVVARATAFPFPTAGPATVQTGQPSIATTWRDGLSFQLHLPKDTYLAGEGGQAEAILRNEGPETVFVCGDGENLFVPVLLDEQGHEPVPWPWSPMRLPGIPRLPSRLDPGQVITDTLAFQTPPEGQAAGHAYVLWAETRFSRPAPDSPDWSDNLWLHLETGPIPLQVTPPDPSQQLVAELEANRDGWRLRVTDTAGRVPPGLLWGFHEIVSFSTASIGPLRDSADGTWSGAWGERMSQSDSQISTRAWLAAPGYVTAAITQTVPGTGDASRWFRGWEPPARQTFDSLETAQATLDFPLYPPGWLPAGAVLDNVQVETRASAERHRTNVSQMYRLPDDTWLELIQMVTTDHYASAGWGQARYEPEARPVAVGQNTGFVIQRFDWWVLDWRMGDVGFELRAPVPALSLDDLLSIATGAQHPGLSLIYHLDGTLYRGGFFGAEAVCLGPLTPDALYNARISGRSLAHAIGGRVMLMDLESGDIRALDPVERPDFRISNLVWSTDGGVLAYAGTYDLPEAPLGQVAEVTVVEIEGDEGRVVTIVITEWIGVTVLGYDRASGRVWLIPRGQDPAFVEVHAYDIKRLAVSPHIIAVSGYGEAVASSDLSRLAVADYDHEAEQALTRVYSLLEPTAPPVVLRHSKQTLGAHYLWSQGRLAYVVLSGFLHWGDSPGEADGIWVWEPGVGEPRQVAEATDEGDAPIACTPDGAWLLVRQTPPGGTPRYAAVPLEGGEPVPMVSSEARVLGWAQGLAAPTVPLSTPSAPRPPTGEVLIYRIGGPTIYAADIHSGEAWQILELPENAGHRCLSDGFLPYTDYDEKTICQADLSTGDRGELYSVGGLAHLDFDVCWSDDGQALAYAVAYEDADGARRVELGTLDGYEQRTITTLTARPAGPTPTPPPMPPMPPSPGYTNLLLLGYDPSAGRIYAVPAGGAERFAAVWAFDAATGERVLTLSLKDPDNIAEMEPSCLAPGFARLAVSQADESTGQTAILIYDVGAEPREPLSYALP